MENVRIQKIEETENQTISTNEIAFSYIFNEYLKNNDFIEEKDFAKEIQNLSLGNNKNILKIAKVLITYTEKNYKIEPDSPLIGNILAMVYEEGNDPVSTWEKAVATALPALKCADELFQATITL